MKIREVQKYIPPESIVIVVDTSDETLAIFNENFPSVKKQD